MTTLEELQAAHERLTHMRDQATPGEWYTTSAGIATHHTNPAERGLYIACSHEGRVHGRATRGDAMSVSKTGYRPYWWYFGWVAAALSALSILIGGMYALSVVAPELCAIVFIAILALGSTAWISFEMWRAQ